MVYRIVIPAETVAPNNASQESGAPPPEQTGGIRDDHARSPHRTPITGPRAQRPPISLLPVSPASLDDLAFERERTNETMWSRGFRAVPRRRIGGIVIVALLLVGPMLAIQLLDIVPLLYEPLCRIDPTPGCFPWDPASDTLHLWANASPPRFLLVKGGALTMMLLALAASLGLLPGRRRKPRLAALAGVAWALLTFG